MIDIACENRSNATTWRNQIDRKRVDFALVHPTTFVTHAVIELDDRSHAHPDRKKRDAFVESLIKRAGIHLVRIPVTASYTPQISETTVRAGSRDSLTRPNVPTFACSVEASIRWTDLRAASPPARNAEWEYSLSPKVVVRGPAFAVAHRTDPSRAQ